MAMEERNRQLLTTTVLEKVGDVISDIDKAKHVEEVILALHSLALLLFPLDSSLFTGSLDQRYRNEVKNAKLPSDDETNDWWQAFYRGAAFPTLARVLLLDVASNWLVCFPISARKYLYDIFFVDGLASEVVQTLVPYLQPNESNTHDGKAIRSNAERLVVVCLLEDDGVFKLAREFGRSCQSGVTINERVKSTISKVAQLVASIPDKAHLGSPALSSHMFFKQITIQLLSGAVETDMKLLDKLTISNEEEVDGTLLFAGETFARICRRGSADVLLSELTPCILRHVQRFLVSNFKLTDAETFKSLPGSRFWFNIIEAMKDQYAVERMSEQLLHQLATGNVEDVEAYWSLWILFHRVFGQQSSVKSMFVDKFLLWKVFPLCCLKWILQFSVFECPPVIDSLKRGLSTGNVSVTVQRLAAVWSKREFVQSASMEQQAYITAAVGLIMERMSKDELDAIKDVMHSILQGVSCRLESPNHLVRKMASSIALVFSKVIDPNNPLYLDDTCIGETVDWEFGFTNPKKGIMATSSCIEKESEKINASTTASNGRGNNIKGRNKKSFDFKFIDPDEIIDPATLNNKSVSDEEVDDDTSENSDTSMDSSLQAYDLADDDTDLKRNFSQLVDVVTALRKSDDADGVEGALDVAEKLVRASPDELKHVAGDLVRTLIQIRCSDLTIDGEEDSAEEKRQRALVALLVTSPIESLDTLNKLLYSPNVDTSQRILVLDVMTEAAQELAYAQTMKLKHQPTTLISTISDTQPWFMPSGIGPPGAGSWKEISGSGTPLNWAYTYEREIPAKLGQIKRGKTRRWSHRSTHAQENHVERSQNKFPVYAAAFMLPAMEGFDKKRQGVDLLGRDFIVLGKLVYMLGTCMKCAAMHPEASALAQPLLDMLSSSEICHHAEAYVRKSVLFTAACVLVALHPSYVASAMVEGNVEISKGLEWIRTFALHVVDSDPDRECYTMAMTCLQLHAEMALQASRALESEQSTTSKGKSIGISSIQLDTIKIPYSNVKY